MTNKPPNNLQIALMYRKKQGRLSFSVSETWFSAEEELFVDGLVPIFDNSYFAQYKSLSDVMHVILQFQYEPTSGIPSSLKNNSK